MKNTFFLKIFCQKFENIFITKCKKIEIKKVKFNFWININDLNY